MNNDITPIPGVGGHFYLEEEGHAYIVCAHDKDMSPVYIGPSREDELAAIEAHNEQAQRIIDECSRWHKAVACRLAKQCEELHDIMARHFGYVVKDAGSFMIDACVQVNKEMETGR